MIMDVTDERHGRWLYDEYGWVCSVCEFPISVRYGQYNYCPNCGAKMDDDDNYCTEENCEIFQRDLNCERCNK